MLFTDKNLLMGFLNSPTGGSLHLSFLTALHLRYARGKKVEFDKKKKEKEKVIQCTCVLTGGETRGRSLLTCVVNDKPALI